ncbi:signal-transducing histidine kinase homolog [Halorubrum sp. DM2]|nr:signal-transducing histidine kinase homolog [Halorubrum sp. DM2]
MVADEGNRRVLESWVNGHNRYTLAEATDIAEAAFDCCLFDTRQLGEKRSELLKRKESEEIILPYLLLVPEPRHREIHDRLRDEHPELWDAIDGVIDMPLTEHRLGEQLETFFRLRNQSRSAYTQREELRRVRDQLDVLNRVLRHDIRNDMNVVVAWGEMLEDEVTPAGREKLDRILRAGRHVVELTNVARDLSALTHGDETPDRKPVSLRQILTAELEKRRATFSDAEITMPEPPDPGTHVLANELLSSVFRNLVNNAVQHNRTAHPKVMITVEDDAESVRVSVADNGPGIPDDVKADLFGAGEKGLESGGTGMGLFLVDSLVEGYGGDVWIEDRAESESFGGLDEADQTGAVFVVELPTTQRSDNREESSK